MLISIECIRCKKVFSPEDVFSETFVASRGMWNDFKCPLCDKVAFFILKGKRLKVGMIDGFLGPVFESESKIFVANLEHEWQEKDLRIKLDANEWLIPYKKQHWP